MLRDDVRAVQAHYPKVFYVCHTRHSWSRSSESRLSARDAGILAHLDGERPTTAARLARHLGVGPPTLSEALKHLERLGYIARARDPRNRRRVLVQLSPRGAAAMQAASVLEPDRLTRVLRRLDRAERRAVVEGLRLLAKAAEDMMEREGERRGRW